jgi:hypothetical protein
MSEEQWEEFIKEVDTSGNGQVSHTIQLSYYLIPVLDWIWRIQNHDEKFDGKSSGT